MGSYIRKYIASAEKALEDESCDLEALKAEHLRQTEFIQHERLIHLIVTVFVGIVLFIGVVIFFISGISESGILDLILLVLTFAYLGYYFFIENATQRLYRIYNKIELKIAESSSSGSTLKMLYDHKEMTK